MHREASFFASLAWVQGGWARDVVMRPAPDGSWSSIEVDATAQQPAIAVASGGKRRADVRLAGRDQAHAAP